jgi:hypothetical protein
MASRRSFSIALRVNAIMMVSRSGHIRTPAAPPQLREDAVGRLDRNFKINVAHQPRKSPVDGDSRSGSILHPASAPALAERPDPAVRRPPVLGHGPRAPAAQGGRVRDPLRISGNPARLVLRVGNPSPSRCMASCGATRLYRCHRNGCIFRAGPGSRFAYGHARTPIFDRTASGSDSPAPDRRLLFPGSRYARRGRGRERRVRAGTSAVKRSVRCRRALPDQRILSLFLSGWPVFGHGRFFDPWHLILNNLGKLPSWASQPAYLHCN